MAKKMTAVLLTCVVLVSALQFSTADSPAEMEARFKSFFGDLSGVEAKFKSCAATCEKECVAKGETSESCKPKCETDCGKKEVSGISFFCLLRKR